MIEVARHSDSAITIDHRVIRKFQKYVVVKAMGKTHKQTTIM